MRALAILFCLSLLPAAAAAQDGATVTVGEDEAHGRYLVGPGGKPLYLFRTSPRGGDDQPGIQSCNERCQSDWPLVPTGGEATAGTGAEADLAASLRWNGRDVLVYDGDAMFTYRMDEAGGAPQGHGIHSYGGWWFLVAPDGSPVAAPGLDEVVE